MCQTTWCDRNLPSVNHFPMAYQSLRAYVGYGTYTPRTLSSAPVMFDSPGGRSLRFRYEWSAPNQMDPSLFLKHFRVFSRDRVGWAMPMGLHDSGTVSSAPAMFDKPGGRSLGFRGEWNVLNHMERSEPPSC